MDRKLFLYFSGFHQKRDEESLKYMLFKDYTQGYSETKEITLDIENLDKVLSDLKKKCKLFDRIHMVASSLGCLPALLLHFSEGYPLTLINPSFFPERTLKADLTKSQTNILTRLKKQIIAIKKGRSLAVYAAADDQRVDYHDFVKVFEDNIWRVEITPVGGHAYTVLPKKIETIMHPFSSGEADTELKVAPDSKESKKYRQMNFINIPETYDDEDDDILEFKFGNDDKCKIEFFDDGKISVYFTASKLIDIEKEVLPEIVKYLPAE